MAMADQERCGGTGCIAVNVPLEGIIGGRSELRECPGCPDCTPDAAEKPKRIWECNVCGHANPTSIDTCEECGEGLYRPASPDAAEGEERWGSFADPKWAWALDADNNVIEGPRQPRLAAHVPLWVVPRARAEAAEADKRDLREELDAALARATTAEDRADASETRERVTHERAEQAESQLAHYRVEVERRQAAIDTVLFALDSSAYVGGPSEREAWRAALDALGPFRTEHQGSALNPDGGGNESA